MSPRRHDPLRGLPAGIIRRGGKLYAKIRRGPSDWVRVATGKDADDIAGAVEERDRLQRDTDARIASGFVDPGPLTVERYYRKWIERRRQSGIASAEDDASRIENHVLSILGKVELADVRPRHVYELVEYLRTKARKLRRDKKGRLHKSDEPLAPRTIINTFAAVRTMFEDAVHPEELIRDNPIRVRRGVLPSKRDADPEWREGAIFTRGEVQAILSAEDKKIPLDRRVFYALCFLTASRFGEAAALRWRHYDTRPKPLGRLLIARSYDTKTKTEGETKTETPRKVPVHPVLRRVLEVWKREGFVHYFGRHPELDDLIVPSRELDERGRTRNRSANHMLKKFHQDLGRVKLRARRQHDARRTFKSIALDDGANESRLRWITHGRKHGVDGAYDEPAWTALCGVVQVMRIKALGAFGPFGPEDARSTPDNPGSDN